MNDKRVTILTLLGFIVGLLALGSLEASAEAEVKTKVQGNAVMVRVTGLVPQVKHQIQRDRQGTWVNRGKKRTNRRGVLKIQRAVKPGQSKAFRVLSKGLEVASFVVTSPKAEPGPQGPQGPTGPQGPQGDEAANVQTQYVACYRSITGALLPDATATWFQPVVQIGLQYIQQDGVDATADYLVNYANADGAGESLAVFLGGPIGCAVGQQTQLVEAIQARYP